MIDIDNQVILKVMKWWRRSKPRSPNFQLYSNKSECWIGGYDKSYEKRLSDIAGFHPSTSISDAWMVVEKLKELDRMIDISTLDDREYENYQCTVWSEDGNDNIFIKDVSAPIAICLAALEAIK